MRSVAILTLVAACGPTPADFGISGYVAPGALNRGSIVALWTLRTDPVKLYKYGDGISVETNFEITFDTNPLPGAIDADGIGVAELIQLPDLSTVPDGIVGNPSSLRVSGFSADHAVIFKAADAIGGPPWAANFGFAYSCARCVRSTNGGLDSYEIAPCLEFTIQRIGSEPCNWY